MATWIVGALVLIGVIVAAALIVRRGGGVVNHSLAPPAPLPAGASDADLLALVAQGQKIEAIKRVRQQTGIGLKEAKEYVEALAAGQAPTRPQQNAPDPSPLDRHDLDAQVRTLLTANQKIEAIKLVRERTGMGLQAAKDYVEGL